MSDAGSGVYGAPMGIDYRCCVCGGELLFRGRPVRSDWRSWFSRSRRLLNEVEFDHAPSCDASVVPSGLLLSMNREQALAEALRRRQPPSSAPPPSAS